MAMNKVRINSDVELKDRLVAINRVTKVTKGGRTFTFAAIVVFLFHALAYQSEQKFGRQGREFADGP